jgi:hypothetical protein
MPRRPRPRTPVSLTSPARGAGQPEIHKAYLRLACLELERARYQRERSLVKARLDSLDERLGAIEAEQRLLRGQTGGSGATAAAAAAEGASAPPKEEPAAARREPAPRGPGFSFRY